MQGYQDSQGMWHDTNKKRSNNVFIYGLYAKLLGLDVLKYPEYYRRCKVKVSRSEITIYRHPNLKTPPLSFDECIGLIGLDLLDYNSLKGNHFVYYGKGERLEKRFFERLVGALAEAMLPRITVKGWRVTVKKPNWKDRNSWWEKNLKNVKHFAVRLTPAHSYIVKKYCGRSYHREEEKLWAFYRDCITKMKPKGTGDYSQKNLLWALHLMNGDAKRAKKLKPWRNFEKYFTASHPFTIAIKKKYGIK